MALRRHGADLKGGLGGGWASTARRQDAPHPSAQADDGRCPPDAAHGGCANRGGRRVVRAEKNTQTGSRAAAGVHGGKAADWWAYPGDPCPTRDPVSKPRPALTPAPVHHRALFPPFFLAATRPPSVERLAVAAARGPFPFVVSCTGAALVHGIPARPPPSPLPLPSHYRASRPSTPPRHPPPPPNPPPFPPPPASPTPPPFLSASTVPVTTPPPPISPSFLVLPAPVSLPLAPPPTLPPTTPPPPSPPPPWPTPQQRRRRPPPTRCCCASFPTFSTARALARGPSCPSLRACSSATVRDGVAGILGGCRLGGGGTLHGGYG